MPAIITHYRFGCDVYDRTFNLIGGTHDEADCFLLGNQGPDVLFYAIANPRIAPGFKLARLMHRASPLRLFQAFADAINELDEAEQPCAQAYTLGFLCHYFADSTIHPLVYAQEYALCDAGEPGLDRSHGAMVHAAIETELDEWVLTNYLETTLDQFKPAQTILRCSPESLATLDKLYYQVVVLLLGAYPNDERLPKNLFSNAFRAFQRVQKMLYSPRGVKRNALGRLESLVRPYSQLQALSHRPAARLESPFINEGQQPWIDPYAALTRHESFEELYQEALIKAEKAVNAWMASGFERFLDEVLPELAGGRNFLGEFVEPAIVDVEDSDA